MCKRSCSQSSWNDPTDQLLQHEPLKSNVGFDRKVSEHAQSFSDADLRLQNSQICAQVNASTIRDSSKMHYDKKKGRENWYDDVPLGGPGGWQVM